jgi:hypothetical protein
VKNIDLLTRKAAQERVKDNFSGLFNNIYSNKDSISIRISMVSLSNMKNFFDQSDNSSVHKNFMYRIIVLKKS